MMGQRDLAIFRCIRHAHIQISILMFIKVKLIDRIYRKS
jgi:hypothetical protein